MLKKLARSIGFTPVEMNIIILLTGLFLAGYLIKVIKDPAEFSIPDRTAYHLSDSLFQAVPNYQLDEEIDGKNVDSKQEVLDFNGRNFKGNKQQFLAEKSINLNTAGLLEFTRLPGIGEKTAEKIIIFRSAQGKFSKLEELLEINGIGNSKFNKIKKYLYIE